MKSHVSLEQLQCPVCGIVHDSGAILINRKLKPSLDPHTVTGLGLCPEHQARWDDGFIAFIEVEPDSPRTITESIRTGLIMHMHRSVAEQVFTGSFDKPIAFIEKGIIARLQASIKQTPSEDPILESTPALIIPIH